MALSIENTRQYVRTVPQAQPPVQQNWWQSYTNHGLPPHKRTHYDTAKLIFDYVLILSTAVLWLPLLLLIAFLIKFNDPKANVFFNQQRTGKNGQRFAMYKFRTMVPDAEARKKDLMHLNELQWPDFKITNDPRITRIGRFLRKTSLDELPQLFNILKRDMSLVGPRPTSFSADTYSPHHMRRLEVLPGLTGLWQVVGRGSTEFDERVILDVDYIERRSLLLDFVLIYHTIGEVIKKRGA